jgi:hypothetical protein
MGRQEIRIDKIYWLWSLRSQGRGILFIHVATDVAINDGD